MTSLKFTLVGDTHVGKKLLLSHCDDSDFVENDRHSGVTIKGSVWENLTVNGKLNHLHLVNASCQTKHNNSNIAPNVLRVLCYARTDVFLVCFSVVNSASFENVKWVWIPEILELFGSRARILLVGMKADLRDDAVTLQRLAATRHRQISWLEAKQYAQAMQAISYVECSGNVKESVQTVLEEAVLAASKPDHATVVPVTLEPKNHAIPTVKCMIVGDKNVGKRRLSDFLQRNPINDTFISERNRCKLDLWHVSGAEDNADLLSKAYKNTKVCLICFNVADPASFANVEHKWFPNINQHCSDALLLLIGTKGQQNRAKTSYELPITTLQGHILAKKIKAVKYIECTW